MPVVPGPRYPFPPLAVIEPLSIPEVTGGDPVVPVEPDPVPAFDVPEFPASLGPGLIQEILAYLIL